MDTTTRTVFLDNFYKPKDGIAEYVADPLKGVSGARAQPHMPLSDLAPYDPRVRKLVSRTACRDRGRGRGRGRRAYWCDPGAGSEGG